MYISGDNDVGGEGGDMKEKHKTDRFKKFFTKLESEELDTGVTSVKFLDFFRVSLNITSILFTTLHILQIRIL